MANIRRETARHDWVPIVQRTPDGERRVTLCRNCRAFVPGWDGDAGFHAELTGCLADVKLANAGHARQKDYLEQEMRLRSAQDRADQRLAGTAQQMMLQSVTREMFDQWRKRQST